MKNDSLYRARRTLHTGQGLLTDRQPDRLMVLFTNPDHIEVEATRGILQRMIAAYRNPNRENGKTGFSRMSHSGTFVTSRLDYLIRVANTTRLSFLVPSSL